MATSAGVQPQVEPGAQPALSAPPSDVNSHDQAQPDVIPTPEETVSFFQNEASLEQLESALLAGPRNAEPATPQIPSTETAQARGPVRNQPDSGPSDADPAQAPKRLRLTGLSETDRNRASAAVRAVEAGDFPDLPSAMVGLGFTQAQATEVTRGGVTDALTGQDSGDSKAKEGTPAAAADPVDAAPIPGSSAALQVQLDTALDELEQAEDSLESPAKLKEIRKTVFDLQNQIQDRKLDERDAAQQQRGYQATLEATVDSLQSQYPDLVDESSPLFRRVIEKREAAGFRKDPILQDPNYLATFVSEAVAELGDRRTAAPATQTPAQQLAANPQDDYQQQSQGPAARQRQQPIGQLAAGNRGAPQVSTEQALQIVNDIDEVDDPGMSERILWDALELGAQKRRGG